MIKLKDKRLKISSNKTDNKDFGGRYEDVNEAMHAMNMGKM